MAKNSRSCPANKKGVEGKGQPPVPEKHAGLQGRCFLGMWGVSKTYEGQDLKKKEKAMVLAKPRGTGRVATVLSKCPETAVFSKQTKAGTNEKNMGTNEVSKTRGGTTKNTDESGGRVGVRPEEAFRKVERHQSRHKRGGKNKSEVPEGL